MFPMKTRQVPSRSPTPAELLRLSKGLRCPLLATRAGISSKTLQRVERGLRWGQAETLERIADALGVDPEVYVIAVFRSWQRTQARKTAA